MKVQSHLTALLNLLRPLFFRLSRRLDDLNIPVLLQTSHDLGNMLRSNLDGVRLVCSDTSLCGTNIEVVWELASEDAKER